MMIEVQVLIKERKNIYTHEIMRCNPGKCACLMTLLTMSVCFVCVIWVCGIYCTVYNNVHRAAMFGRQLRLWAPVAPRPRTWHQSSVAPEAGQWGLGSRMSTRAPGPWSPTPPGSSVTVSYSEQKVRLTLTPISRPKMLCLSSVRMCAKIKFSLIFELVTQP